jgi:hypothetical protein
MGIQNMTLAARPCTRQRTHGLKGARAAGAVQQRGRKTAAMTATEASGKKETRSMTVECGPEAVSSSTIQFSRDAVPTTILWRGNRFAHGPSSQLKYVNGRQ